MKLTEEEKETFVSEGLPIPNRIPLTKVSELQELTRLNQNEINYKEVAFIFSQRKKVVRDFEACHSNQ